MSTVFRVILEGSQEVPPNNSTASGVGTVMFDSAAVAASYSFDIQGLDFGPITSGQPLTRPQRCHQHAFSQPGARRKRTRCLRADQPRLTTTTTLLLCLMRMAPGR